MAPSLDSAVWSWSLGSEDWRCRVQENHGKIKVSITTRFPFLQTWGFILVTLWTCTLSSHLWTSIRVDLYSVFLRPEAAKAVL